MIEQKIRHILIESGKLSADAGTIALDSDLYEAGLTSLTTVNVMLAIEDEFDIEFDDSLLNRNTFQSIVCLMDAVERMAPAEAQG